MTGREVPDRGQEEAGPRRVVRREALGAVVIVLVGSALHFIFDWLGGWPPLALVAPVNESIWEHLKLAFWPGLGWALVERRVSPEGARQLWPARGLSLLLMAAAIVGVFGAYTWILGENRLALDIATFVFAVVAGQALFAWLRTRGPMAPWLRTLGIGLLLAQLVAFSLFTYFPPEAWLFVERGTGVVGIPG